ncbi:hypothetical protein TB9_21305 [Xanthomonas perforans]|nr:hypothetical protein XP816_00775 [Xanthomonas perforans]KLD08935.1 hypothetical protein GEV1044_22945 [Xanthomonas perforans]KLD31924.1 hypothetical protein TB9_21305 [Xanthomonas perforans]OMQ21281.1 hypothetical protein XpCFBP7293_20345 [Xanthomonas perforans]TQT60611.1 hypothetical protein DB857_23815 [Xanthomonas perforans]
MLEFSRIPGVLNFNCIKCIVGRIYDLKNFPNILDRLLTKVSDNYLILEEFLFFWTCQLSIGHKFTESKVCVSGKVLV